jgi:hypothetical protein
MLTLLSLVSTCLAQSQYVMTSQWLDDECANPPSAMYAWNLTDTNRRSPSSSMRWPAGYTFQARNRVHAIECFGSLKGICF